MVDSRFRRRLDEPSVIPAEAGIQSGRIWRRGGRVASGGSQTRPYRILQRSPFAGVTEGLREGLLLWE